MANAGDSMTGEERYLRLSKCVEKVGTLAMKKHVESVFPDLAEALKKQRSKLLALELQGAVTDEQWKMLYGPGDNTPARSAAGMDISLMSFLLNNLAPSPGFGPVDKISTEGIRSIRNYLGRLPVESMHFDRYHENIISLEKYVLNLCPDLKHEFEDILNTKYESAIIKQEAKAARKNFFRQRSEDIPSEFSPVKDGQFFLYD